VMHAMWFQSKELDTNAVYALTMTSVANVNLIMFIIIPCLRSEEMNRHPNLFSVLMKINKMSHKTPRKNLLTFQRVLSIENQLKRKLTTRQDLSKKTLVIDTK